MAGYIKGVTIEFSADVQKLNNGLKSTQAQVNKTQSELRKINTALKFNPGNTTLLKQKFDVLKQAVADTEGKLEELERLQRQMDKEKVDQNSAAYRELEREILKTKQQLDTATRAEREFGSVGKQQILAVGTAFKTAGGKIKAAGRSITTTVSMYGVAGVYAGAKLIDMSEKQAQAEQKLAEIYKSRMGVGKKAVASTLQLASAEQKAGVVGDEVQIAAAQQLATYAKLPGTVNTMLPALNDLLVQQKGLNGTQEDATALANLFGKAMMGQTGALKRAGISFTAAQEEVLKYGTEEEKAAMIAEVVNQNVGQMNETFAQTDAGKIQQAKNALGDMGEQIGAILLPAVANLVSWFQVNLLPKLQQLIDFMQQHPAIAQFALAFMAIMAVLGPLIMMLGSLVSIVGTIITIAPAVGAAFTAMTGPVGWVIAAIAAAIAIGVALYKNWDTIKAKAAAVFKAVKATFSKMKDAMTKPFTDAWAKIKGAIDKIKSFFPLKIGKLFKNLKLPYFSVKGKAPFGIGGKGVKPGISVKWHDKAMTEPYMFSNATLFGAGETGDEMLYGRQALMRDIAEASGGGINYTALASAIVTALTDVDTSIVLNIDGKNVADTTAPYMNTAINKIQARQNRQLGFVGV